MLWMAPESVSASLAGLEGVVLMARTRSGGRASAERKLAVGGGLLAIELQGGSMAGLEEAREATKASDGREQARRMPATSI